MREKINLFVVGIISLVLFASLSNAFGVSSSYWKGNPVTLYPGEEKIVSLTLQNMVNPEDITVKAKLTSGSEIASTEETEYLVRAGTKDTSVPIKIKIPENVPIDSKYVITVSFETITPGGSGAVAIGTGVDTAFDVLVVQYVPPAESPPQPGKGLTLAVVLTIIITIIILIALILLIVKRKKTQVTAQLT